MAATVAATAMDVDEVESWLESVNGGISGEAAGDGPALGEYEGLTVRSVCVGLVLGSVTTVENIYFALKYGWTVSNNLTAAILGFVVISGWRRFVPSAPAFTPQENCVLMTTAVAATAMVWGGSMPFAILAMSADIRDAVGFENDAETWEPTIPRLLVYAGSLCFIGFCLAIPLARKYVVDEPLPFPYALAAAKTIEGLHDGGDDGAPQFLLRTTLPAVAFAMGTWCYSGVERLAVFGQTAKDTYHWQLNLSVAPFGHGFIVPARFVLSELLGACVASGILIPLAEAREGDWYDVDAPGFQGIQAYYYVPAIFAVAFDSVYQLLKVVWALFSSRRNRAKRETAIPLLPGGSLARRDDLAKAAAWSLDVPFRVWGSAWAAFSAVALAVFPLLFGCRISMTAVALLSSPLWSVGITLAVGTTGSNVASSCGKVMIIAFASWYGEPRVVATLALGALSIAVIDQALDLVRDLKTAHLLRASPKAMVAAQAIGASVSILTSAVAYAAYVRNVDLPSAELPAVIAKSYRGLAFAFAGGVDALPRHCLALSVACGALAVAFDAARDALPERRRDWCPSGIAFGVGMILLSGQVLAACCGLATFHVWKRRRPDSAERRGSLFGAALLCGDGIAGVVQSCLEVAGVAPPWAFAYPAWWP